MKWYDLLVFWSFHSLNSKTKKCVKLKRFSLCAHIQKLYEIHHLGSMGIHHILSRGFQYGNIFWVYFFIDFCTHFCHGGNAQNILLNWYGGLIYKYIFQRLFGPYGLLLLHVNEKAKHFHNIKFGIKKCMCYILSHF